MASSFSVGLRYVSYRPHFSPRSIRYISSTSQSLQHSIPIDNTPKNTHFKITLRRSAISLGKRIKGTLESLGIHRRMQTVYHPHSPEVAGKILSVKELVDVENVPEDAVRTKEEQRQERKSPKGYEIVGSRLNKNNLDV